MTRLSTPSFAGQRLPRGGWFYGPLVGLVWMTYPFMALLASDPSPLRLSLSLLGAAAFAAILLWLFWFHQPLHAGTATPEEVWRRRIAVAVLVVLALLLTSLSAGEWLALFFHINVVTGIMLLRRDAYIAIIAYVPVIVVTGLATGDLAGLAFPMAAIGLWATGFVSQVAAVAELKAAREELAQFAVAQERLRFARDLHDLLGHSLSLITVKTELADKLIPVAPERASQEVREAREVARRALREVREAVAGYRSPSLSDELHGAKEMLDAAGIACTVEHHAGALPRPVETLLAWTVREGATNVLRHSRARTCTIRLTRIAGPCPAVRAEVCDDGRGPAPGDTDAGTTGGSGLAGLAERVAAVPGAAFQAEALHEGGFRLSVCLPVDADGDTDR